MARNDEFAPCQFIEHDDGSYSLTFTDFDKTEETFEEMDQEGGGYSWHGVVDALVRMKAPELQEKLEYDPEGSMFVALSRDRQEAIANADPELMD